MCVFGCNEQWLILFAKKNKTLKNFKIKSKENKISHGRGNSH